eukprot:7831837-Pyramimonas_sp.AAC.1
MYKTTISRRGSVSLYLAIEPSLPHCRRHLRPVPALRICKDLDATQQASFTRCSVPAGRTVDGVGLSLVESA